MGMEPRDWRLLETSARNVLGLHAQLAAVARRVEGLLARQLNSDKTVEELHLLDHLCRDGDGMSVGALAKALVWPRTTMSRVVARLEAAGHVEAAVFDDDARKRTIWLTETGHRQRIVLMEQIAMEMLEVEMRLRGTEIASLRESIRQMGERLDKLAPKKKRRRRR